jgi:hypothetical protein
MKIRRSKNDLMTSALGPLQRKTIPRNIGDLVVLNESFVARDPRRPYQSMPNTQSARDIRRCST